MKAAINSTMKTDFGGGGGFDGGYQGDNFDDDSVESFGEPTNDD